MSGREANRLSSADVRAITVRLHDTANEWTTHRRPMPRDGASVDALLRIAYHAIGCCEADLRDVELRLIADVVADELASRP